MQDPNSIHSTAVLFILFHTRSLFAQFFTPFGKIKIEHMLGSANVKEMIPKKGE